MRFRGDRLRELREARKPKLSQGGLGKSIGAHVTSISDWERGANAPSGRHVASLAREFGVSVEHFYAEDDDEEAAQVDDITLALGAAVRAAVAAEFARLAKEVAA